MNAAICDRPHILYRCFDAEDRLIYIGVTSMPVKKRMRVHKRSNPDVYEQTVRWTEETCPNRESALDVEANAIYREKPPLNYRFNPVRSHLAGMTRVDPPTMEDLREAISRIPSGSIA